MNNDDDKDPASVLDKIKDCPLHRRTPYGIQNVSMTQFSVARHFGACRFNGDDYTYLPETDELIRDDVMKWLNTGVDVALAKSAQPRRRAKQRRGT